MNTTQLALTSLVDPAFILAFVAILFTMQQWRRTHRTVLKILACEYGLTKDASGTFFRFIVRLRNQGITLHSAQLVIDFQLPQGGGRVSLPLHHWRDDTPRDARLERGMVAEFGLRTDRLNKTAERVICHLEDFEEQDALLCVYAQGYLAKTIRIGGRWEHMKDRWNTIAGKVNKLFRSNDWVPTFAVIYFQLAFFIQAVRDETTATEPASNE